MVFRVVVKNRKNFSAIESYILQKYKSKAREGKSRARISINLSPSISQVGFLSSSSFFGSFLLCIESGLSTREGLANVFCRFFVARQNTTRSVSPKEIRLLRYFAFMYTTTELYSYHNISASEASYTNLPNKCTGTITEL